MSHSRWSSPPLCIVPARAESKRCPGKNFKSLGGVSPLTRAIRCCATIPNAQIVVTGDWVPKDERADSGVYYHHRPGPLAADSASMVDVVVDVLDSYPGTPGQPVLLVQPTQPLRRPEHLHSALTMLETASSVASITETESLDKLYTLTSTPCRLHPLGQSTERDQDSTATFKCDGTVYGFLRGWFLAHRSFRHADTRVLLIPEDETCALDTPHDWLVASLLLHHLSR